MKKKTVLKKTASVALAASMVAGSALPAMAASSTDKDNNTATKNDLQDADIIDESKTGSLTIVKYDITSAIKDGVMSYDQETQTTSIAGKQYEATGESNSEVETTLADYAIEGIGFSYLYCGQVETYSHFNEETQKTEIQVVYEIDDELREILGLSTDDAIDVSADGVAETTKTHESGKYHYNTTQISKAMATILEKGAGATEDDEAPVGKNGAPAGNKSAKDALEAYLESNDAAVHPGDKNGLALTDSNGYTTVSNLKLGLYLIVETSVPEEVVESVNPWFVTLPFTDSDGEEWLYDCTCYPKNQTGSPTLDKLVRNATGELEYTDEQEDGAYKTEEYNYITSNLLEENDQTAQEFAEERGDDQTSEGEYKYGDTTTASEGDVLDYILVSHIPHIQSTATYLTDYSFYDRLTEGITYNEDARIAFYATQADAMVNDTSKAVEIWGLDMDASEAQNKGYGNYNQEYVELKKDYDRYNGSTELSITFTEAGLKRINEEFSDYYIVIYYTGTLNSDATAVLGDDGNPNDVTLVWKRTTDGYYNTLEDRCYVYTFGIDMTKLFADGKGDPTKVKFVVYNETDGYYLIAKEGATVDNGDGDMKVYYVTGKTTDKSEATEFSPAEDGQFKIYGVEGDSYQLTETATDKGYSLLKDQIAVDIVATTRNVDPAEAGYVGKDAETGHTHTDACYISAITVDENGVPDFSDKVLICGQAETEEANGRTTEKIPMLIEDYTEATASVNGVAVDMSEYYVSRETEFDGTKNVTLAGNYKDGVDGFQAVLAASSADGGAIESTDGIVNIEVTNNVTTKLPQTGGTGLYAITIAGIVAAAGGLMVATKKKKSA